LEATFQGRILLDVFTIPEMKRDEKLNVISFEFLFAKRERQHEFIEV